MRKVFIFSIFSLLIFYFSSEITIAKENYLISQEVQTSDIRLELISEIQVLEDDLKELKIKLKNTKDPKEKKAIKNKIDAIQEKLKTLKKELENYDKILDSVS